uniref:Retrovirus-related Pol polyprotein from transposon TNT 1-94 n=1 Tax=Bactrocera dorsalis TaxID=27457 RepID=A0A034WSQ9_BACDO
MKLTKNKMVFGIENVKFADSTQCKTCMKSKIHTQPFPAASDTDVCGPFEKRSLGGSSYFLTFIDDMSRRIFTFFLKSKDEVFENFVTFKKMVECQIGRKIKVLRSDNGREYINKRFDDFLKQQGVTRQLTVPYIPQQYGVAEQVNRTLVEMTRSLLVHSNMPAFL